MTCAGWKIKNDVFLSFMNQFLVLINSRDFMMQETKSWRQFVFVNLQSGSATESINFSTSDVRLLIFTETLFESLRTMLFHIRANFQTLNLPLWIDFFLFKKSRDFDQLIFTWSLFLDPNSQISRICPWPFVEFIMNFIKFHFINSNFLVFKYENESCWASKSRDSLIQNEIKWVEISFWTYYFQ